MFDSKQGNTSSNESQLIWGLAGLVIGGWAIFCIASQIYHRTSFGLDLVFIDGFFVFFSAICWCFALRSRSKRSDYLFKCAWSGAVILGVIGFCLGFFGPMFFGGGNQGPLLGIFISGPLGLVCGFVIGLGYGFLTGEK